jgi:hypothetical protein
VTNFIGKRSASAIFTTATVARRWNRSRWFSIAWQPGSYKDICMEAIYRLLSWSERAAKSTVWRSGDDGYD